MIKKLLLFSIVCVLLFCSREAAFAADINLQWGQSERAVGYKIEISIDLGATWTEVPDLTYTTFVEGNLNLAMATITVADNVLVLGRVGAFNDKGTSWRLEQGIYYNSAWMPPPSPTGLGVN